MASLTDKNLAMGVEDGDDGVAVKAAFFRNKAQAERRAEWAARSDVPDSYTEAAHYISCDELAAVANLGYNPYAIRDSADGLGTSLYRMKGGQSNQLFDKWMDGQVVRLLRDEAAEFTPKLRFERDGETYTYATSEIYSRVQKKAELACAGGFLTPEYLDALRVIAIATGDGRILNGYVASDVSAWRGGVTPKLRREHAVAKAKLAARARKRSAAADAPDAADSASASAAPPPSSAASSTASSTGTGAAAGDGQRTPVATTPTSSPGRVPVSGYYRGDTWVSPHTRASPASSTSSPAAASSTSSPGRVAVSGYYRGGTWVSPHTRASPASSTSSPAAASSTSSPAAASSTSSPGRVAVSGYYRGGTWVSPHTRASPSRRKS